MQPKVGLDEEQNSLVSAGVGNYSVCIPAEYESNVNILTRTCLPPSPSPCLHSLIGDKIVAGSWQPSGSLAQIRGN